MINFLFDYQFHLIISHMLIHFNWKVPTIPEMINHLIEIFTIHCKYLKYFRSLKSSQSQNFISFKLINYFQFE